MLTSCFPDFAARSRLSSDRATNRFLQLQRSVTAKRKTRTCSCKRVLCSDNISQRCRWNFDSKPLTILRHLFSFFWIDDRLYSAILRSFEQTHCARVWFYMSDWLFIARFLNIYRSGVLTALPWLVPHETAAVSAQVLCTCSMSLHAKPHT